MYIVDKFVILHSIITLQCQIENGGVGNLFECICIAYFVLMCNLSEIMLHYYMYYYYYYCCCCCCCCCSYYYTFFFVDSYGENSLKV